MGLDPCSISGGVAGLDVDGEGVGRPGDAVDVLERKFLSLSHSQELT